MAGYVSEKHPVCKTFQANYFINLEEIDKLTAAIANKPADQGVASSLNNWK
jgi:hypothetical protein